MTIWTAKVTLDGKRQCARCHKMFLPRTPEQKYGPTCAKKIVDAARLEAGVTPEGLAKER